MRSKLLDSALALMMLTASVSSCEKLVLEEGTESGNAGQPNVVLRVVQFEQVPFEARTRASVEAYCSRLNFAVYDSTGVRVKQVNQKEGDADFGQAAFSLAEGCYHLVVLAHSGDGNPTMTNPAKIVFSNKIGFTDTFLYDGQLTVGASNQELSLALKRIVAKVRFIADDALPRGATIIRFYYTGGAGTFDATTGYGSAASKQVETMDVTGSEQQFEIFTIPHAEADSLTVLVSTYSEDADGTITIYSEKTIEDIPIQRNRVTVCQGRLFDGEAVATRSTSLSLSLDDAWGDDIVFHY